LLGSGEHVQEEGDAKVVEDHDELAPPHRDPTKMTLRRTFYSAEEMLACIALNSSCMCKI
jgi:hypothetical protein